MYYTRKLGKLGIPKVLKTGSMFIPRRHKKLCQKRIIDTRNIKIYETGE